MKTKKYLKGFTLVELLLVIAIIAILATVLFVSLGSQRERARVSAFKENARGLVTTFTACADGGGQIIGTAAGTTNLDGLTAVCADRTGVAGSNKSGIVSNVPSVPSCDGAGSFATIQTYVSTGDSWNFDAKCARSTDYCVMHCSADGCAANTSGASPTSAVDATSKCE